MKTADIEQMAEAAGDDRWRIWVTCGPHHWRKLPKTETGDHVCPTCCTIWTPEGAIQEAGGE